MAFTIEPGVYIPSHMGIRIEDNILTGEQNSTILTRILPKEFAWWA